MFVLTQDHKLVNLDRVEAVIVSEVINGYYRVLAVYGNESERVLVQKCESKEEALNFIKQISAAMAYGERVYVIGVDPRYNPGAWDLLS